ncbi:MAG TPA: VWA domain-containing protein [Vicinamibacterales bacterium]|nr:VWA domain-containing protein [Vicinamibacterales bacterium]
MLAGLALAVGVGRMTTDLTAIAQPPAPQAPPPTPPQPTFRTEANYVRVDVFPTRGGVPVADLAQSDFEVLEDRVAQRIEQFERVVIRGNLPQDLRTEPNSVAAGRQAAENPRARVFVVFLDINHVSVEGSHAIRQPLVDTLNRLIGADDVFAVMTPEMSARDLVFARRTTTIENILARYWTWGERDRQSWDPQEQQYQYCYPGSPPVQCPDGGTADDRGIADKMIERRREKVTLDALTDLVRYLRGVREERKAVIAVSDGWRLFQQDNDLINRRTSCDPPRVPGQIGVDPRGGKLTAKPPPTTDLFNTANPDICERDRIQLGMLDDESEFRALLDEANRANTSFYPVDPRGLVVFDEPIDKMRTGLPPPGSTTITPPAVDNARLRARLTTLRTLADATDGLAIVDSNNLAAGMKRIVDDLSAYYLLGYYSSGKLDGKFHAITVRVKRPGVQVRARRGYLAATPAAMTAAGGGAATPADPAAAAETHAIESAIAPLAGYARDVPLRVQVAAGWKAGSDPTAAMWVVGELGGVATVGDAWAEGFDATATLTTSADATAASGRVTVPRGVRTFRIALTAPQPLEPGDYVLRVGARAGAASIPRETARVTLLPSPEPTGALFVRRGPTTGNRDLPTADLRFRRSEQLRVEIPSGGTAEVSARLLDRTGKALNIPVTAVARDDPDGARWQTAQVALAPLAPGDYVIEIASGERRSISAFRVIP